ncbi:unnamed protein product [Calicophoron daubneyi]|uniref:Uncharacterized protein n=1 Tax=Calicophoron daubneyi TaxID=300641 RepID=A0AAV2TVH0_CALDB
MAKLSVQAAQFQSQPTQALSPESILGQVSEFHAEPKPTLNFDECFKHYEAAPAQEQVQAEPAKEPTIQPTEMETNEHIPAQNQTQKQAEQTLDVGEVKEVQNINFKRPLEENEISLTQEKPEEGASISSVTAAPRDKIIIAAPPTPIKDAQADATDLDADDPWDEDFDNDHIANEKDKSEDREVDNHEQKAADEELLLQRLAKTKRERAQRAARLIAERKATADAIRIENMLNTGANSDFKWKRCLNDVIVYKNSVCGDRGQSPELPSKKTLLNHGPKESAFVQRKKKNKTDTDRLQLALYNWKKRKKKITQEGNCAVEKTSVSSPSESLPKDVRPHNLKGEV